MAAFAPNQIRFQQKLPRGAVPDFLLRKRSVGYIVMRVIPLGIHGVTLPRAECELVPEELAETEAEIAESGGQARSCYHKRSGTAREISATHRLLPMRFSAGSGAWAMPSGGSRLPPPSPSCCAG